MYVFSLIDYIINLIFTSQSDNMHRGLLECSKFFSAFYYMDN
jgi:hypothetical protein